MQRYILGRLIQGVITLLVVSLLVFGMARLSGSPIDLMLDINATDADRARLSQLLGLDEPLPVQYGLFIGDLVRGNLGTSIRTREPVTEVLASRIPNTLALVVLSILLALAIAIPLALLAATHKNSVWDVGARVLALLGQSIPSFWAANVLILIFAVQLRWLPSGRKEGLEHFVLPVVATALFGFLLAGSLRLLRGSMLEILDSEYVKFARTKGVPEHVVIGKHALRNALIPLVTFAGSYFGILMGGSVVLESVFAWPGVGRLAYEAVQWRDYPLIQGVVLYVSAMIISVNLCVDILYAYLDPRIRYT